MPVRMEKAIREGWKQEDNKRFGQCLEVRFVDTATNKVMFRYAPLLSDKEFWISVFKDLHDYDTLHKQIFSLTKRIDGDSTSSFSECTKEVQNAGNDSV